MAEMQMQRQRPEAAKAPLKRAANDVNDGGECSSSMWKRIKAEPRESYAQTRRGADNTVSTSQPQRTLGAWFTARASQIAMTQPQPQPGPQPQPLAWARVKVEDTREDSEDDRPLSSVVPPREHHKHVPQRASSQSEHAGGRLHAPRLMNRQAGRAEVTPRKTQERAVTKMKTDGEEQVFQLSAKRRVTVRQWRSTILVDIREYYEDNGISKPGKKGISLSNDQWNTLLRLSRTIDEAVRLVEEDSVDEHSLEGVSERIAVRDERTIAFTLSAKRRITVRHFRTAVLIDLREYYDQGGEMKPGKKGISLSKEQWRSLQKIDRDISDAIAAF